MYLLNLLIKNPMLRTLVAIIPMAWGLVVLDFFGIDLGFRNSDGNITDNGKVITISMFIVIGVYIFLTNWLVPLIDSRKNSKARIRETLNALIKSIHEISGVDENYISASLFFAFDGNRDNCQYVVTSNKPGLQQNIILNEKGSFGRYLLDDSPHDFELLNDVKSEGELKGKYILNSRNKEMFEITKKYGSTIGLRIIEHPDNQAYGTPSIQAVLFSSTFGYEIANDSIELKREEVKRLIERVILPPIVMQIKTELTILHKATLGPFRFLRKKSVVSQFREGQTT
ncbi:MAG: hypothetical protein FWE57_01890 [Chitinispirillia bacterium]|nr:hypothetical protein [Chitinispirillia bacterium]